MTSPASAPGIARRLSFLDRYLTFLSTMVVDGPCVKVLAYDNEWGYVNRMVELARKVGQSLK